MVFLLVPLLVIFYCLVIIGAFSLIVGYIIWAMLSDEKEKERQKKDNK